MPSMTVATPHTPADAQLYRWNDVNYVVEDPADLPLIEASVCAQELFLRVQTFEATGGASPPVALLVGRGRELAEAVVRAQRDGRSGVAIDSLAPALLDWCRQLADEHGLEWRWSVIV